jgi:hypothetical protein
MDFYFLPCGWVASFLLRLFVVAIFVLGHAGPNPPRVSVDHPSRDSGGDAPVLQWRSRSICRARARASPVRIGRWLGRVWMSRVWSECGGILNF